MAVLDIIFTIIGWVKHSYYDWATALIMGSTSDNIYQAVMGQITHIFFAGGLGIIFAYIIKYINSKNYILKGWIYGVVVWFVVHVIVSLFEFKPLSPIPFSQMVSDLVTASIYGIVLVEALHRIGSNRNKAS